MSVEIRETLPGDAENFGHRLSPADRLEAWLASGRPPEEALIRSVKQSSLCWSIFIDDKLVAMAGAGPTGTPDLGVPWLLSSLDISDRPVTVARKLILCRNLMLAVFPRLFNYVYADNQSAVRLVRGLGFSLSDQPEPYGWCGAPFVRFSMGGV